MIKIPRRNVRKWSERQEHSRGIYLRSLINIHIYPGAVFGADASVKENTPGAFSTASN